MATATGKPPADEVDETSFSPMLGDTVFYVLSDRDIDHLTRNPAAHFTLGNAGVLNPYASSVAVAGSVVPAVVTRVWSPVSVNLQVLCDAPGTLWVVSRVRGDGPGEWQAPR